MTNYEKIKAMSVEEMAGLLMATGFSTVSLFMKKLGFEGLSDELFDMVCEENKQDWITMLESEVEEDMLPEIYS